MLYSSVHICLLVIVCGGTSLLAITELETLFIHAAFTDRLRLHVRHPLKFVEGVSHLHRQEDDKSLD